MSPLARLHAVLDATADWTFAVSGGVDSMTLATLAHRRLARAPRMVHATSPAVPAAARAVVEAQAGAEGWDLRVIEAGEFADARYRANPADRCYFCKSNLYAGILREIAQAAGGVVASGTNTDDLGDWRPGLRAAEEHGVRHPFVEADISKAEIRALARAHDLPFAELPAQPCLASRVETGLRVEPDDLAFIDGLETRLRALLASGATLRVRLRREGVAVEHGAETPMTEEALRLAREACRESGRAFLGAAAYRRGSAFLKSA